MLQARGKLHNIATPCFVGNSNFTIASYVILRVTLSLLPMTSINHIRHPIFVRQSRLVCWAPIRSLSGATRLQDCHTGKSQRPKSSKCEDRTCQNENSTAKSSARPLSTLQLPFWTCRSTWRRASINTLRCLVGCTSGDFSALWILQTYYPELGMGSIMAISSESSLERIEPQLSSLVC